jgi:hypothetical protein
MRWTAEMEMILHVNVVLLAAIIGGILMLGPEVASDYRLYEVFGGLLAASLTSFGLKEMKKLT